MCVVWCVVIEEMVAKLSKLSVQELRDTVKAENFDGVVRTDVGGKSKRTKQDIANDIAKARAGQLDGIPTRKGTSSPSKRVGGHSKRMTSSSLPPVWQLAQNQNGESSCLLVGGVAVDKVVTRSAGGNANKTFFSELFGKSRNATIETPLNKDPEFTKHAFENEGKKLELLGSKVHKDGATFFWKTKAVCPFFCMWV